MNTDKLVEVSASSISMALSGGGHRAAAFHLGVLKYLAECRQLSCIDHISSVSGGSILVAELMSDQEDALDTDACWLNETHFLTTALSRARGKIITRSLQSDFIKRMIKPRNWINVGRRANLMSESLQSLWGIQNRLADMPERPKWFINATSNFNGQRWLFFPDSGGYRMGDDRHTVNCRNLKTASAVAASAAYPVVIGPYRLHSPEPVYLSDGGLYDNLGLEALFDMESDQLKFPAQQAMLIVSDAGTALKTKKLPAIWRPFSRLRRMINIMGQQVRILRLRSLRQAIEKQPRSIVCLSIGTCWAAVKQSLQSKGSEVPDIVAGYEFLTHAEVSRAANLPTTLASLSASDTDLLIRHGYETALIMFSLKPDERHALNLFT